MNLDRINFHKLRVRCYWLMSLISVITVLVGFIIRILCNLFPWLADGFIFKLKPLSLNMGLTPQSSKITFCWHILLYCPRERKWCFSYIFQCESSQEQEPGNFIYERFTQTIGSIIVFFSHTWTNPFLKDNSTFFDMYSKGFKGRLRMQLMIYFAYVYCTGNLYLFDLVLILCNLQFSEKI